MKFKYSATDKKGKLVEGEMIAQSQEEVERSLSEEELVVLDVVSLRESQEREEKRGIRQLLLGGKASLDDKIQFFANLSTMLKAGLPATEALDILKTTAANKNMKEILEVVLFDLREGSTFSGSLSKFPKVFSSMDLSLFEVGEAGGTLEQNIKTLADQLQNQKDLRSKIKSAMMYPVVITIALLAISIILIVYVIPRITGFFEEANLKLPFMTKLLITLSDVLISYGIFILALLIIGVLLFRYFYKGNKAFKKKIDTLVFKIPFAGNLLKKLYVARFCRTLGALLQSGVPILESLEIVEKGYTNVIFKEAIADIGRQTEEGTDLSVALESQSHLFYPIVYRLVKVGTKTGTVDQSLNNVAQYYEDEVSEVFENLSSIIEPVLLLVMGVGVAIIALSVLSPIYQLVGGISETQ